jgi:CO/xanthine dehydrogenase FAD-binding subunit
MFTLVNLVAPDTIEEAYRVLIERRNNAVLGGCAFLRMGSQRIGTGVDLSRLNLNYIKETDDSIEIGAMTTFRAVETSPLLLEYFGGILPAAVRNIIGVQFRNLVVVGASVYARYGFSDLLTALLVLDTEVELYKGGRLSLETFLTKPYEKDILTRVFIHKSKRAAAYQNLRNSASDYPILNVAVAQLDEQWKIAVGARPLRAAIAHKASAELSKIDISKETIERAAQLAAEELIFGTNRRGTAEYRQAMCQVLVKRAIREVLQCE